MANQSVPQKTRSAIRPPWTVVRERDTAGWRGISVKDAEDGFVANVVMQPDGSEMQIARLISAAPDGYELAQLVLTLHAYLSYPTNFKTLVEKATAIIAKAEGR